MPFEFQQLKLPEVLLIRSRVQRDPRGLFRETYRASEFAANGIRANFVQDNHSHSGRGVLRGLHYQMNPRAQGKLMIVIAGMIYDVAVDIRRGSPTFGQWVGQELAAEDGCMLYVPPGFAHGFCVLSENVDLIYKVTAEYAPECERGIIWNDPDIGVRWPIAPPTLSPRDLNLPRLRDAENNFQWVS